MANPLSATTRIARARLAHYTRLADDAERERAEAEMAGLTAWADSLGGWSAAFDHLSATATRERCIAGPMIRSKARDVLRDWFLSRSPRIGP